MQRAISTALSQWYQMQERKPLVLRGARQVGKTWIARELARQHDLQLIELNFEKKPEYSELFNSNDPQEIIRHIAVTQTKEIHCEKALLFLDEIQVAPELLSKLRWFAESLPELAVIAASSLLEFVLADHTFSMPVGRIQYMYLEPMSFVEFLQADGMESLVNYMILFQWQSKIPEAVHQQLMQAFKYYMLVGGLPAAVSIWKDTHDLMQVNRIHHDLLATYRDDFSKYAGRLETHYLNDILTKSPLMLGRKFKYSHIDSDNKIRPIKKALQLLTKSRLCHLVYVTDGNGVPLAAEVKLKTFKVIMLDVGCACALLGLDLQNIATATDLKLVNQGGISEQVVGQLLRTINPFYIEPALYYWVRDKKGSAAEIDYLIQYRNEIVPIEVKSGSTGSLKSLHLFMASKKANYAVRVNADLPSVNRVNNTIHDGEKVNYILLSIPFYLLSDLHRLLDMADVK